MSLWVFPPQVIDTQSETVIFKTEDINWSLEYSKWLSDTVVRLGLRKYPGSVRPNGIVVEIDLSKNRAIIDADLSVPIEDLGHSLESVMALANHFGAK